MKKTVKGFTLVELVVVIAIFSVIMFGALQLMHPVENIFTNSYKAESVSASVGNISNYLESELRYAEHIKIQQSLPTQDELRQFIIDNYDGKIKLDVTGGATAATGKIHILEVDNTAGGVVNKWELNYTAGDRQINMPGDAPADTAVEPVIDTISATPDSASVINKAMYNDYHFNVSLGIWKMGTDGKLARDTEYYESYSDVHMKAFGNKNFGLTITAYEYNPAKSKDRTLSDDGITYVYNPGYVYTSSIGLINAIDSRTYYKYQWKRTETPAGSGNFTAELNKDSEGNVTLTDSYAQQAFFQNKGLDSTDADLTNPNPEHIYFVYTYSAD